MKIKEDENPEVEIEGYGVGGREFVTFSFVSKIQYLNNEVVEPRITHNYVRTLAIHTPPHLLFYIKLLTRNPLKRQSRSSIFLKLCHFYNSGSGVITHWKREIWSQARNNSSSLHFYGLYCHRNMICGLANKFWSISIYENGGKLFFYGLISSKKKKRFFSPRLRKRKFFSRNKGKRNWQRTRHKGSDMHQSMDNTIKLSWAVPDSITNQGSGAVVWNLSRCRVVKYDLRNGK